MSALRLFVMGPSSPDPSTWSEWDEPQFVLAHNAEEAARLLSRTTLPVEIPLEGEPRVLYEAPSPELWWGDDA